MSGFYAAVLQALATMIFLAVFCFWPYSAFSFWFADGFLGEFSLEAFCKLAKGFLICCIFAIK